MFQHIRINLTVAFFILSVTVFLFISGIAALAFYNGLTEALDEQLAEIATGTIPLVDYKDGKLLIRDAVSPLKVSIYHATPTITLFDTSMHIVSAIGPKGSGRFLFTGDEFPIQNTRVRALSRPIKVDGNAIGHLQVELSTAHRDRALTEFLQAIGIAAPFLILALGGTGYWLSGKAIKPMEETFAVLKQFMSDAGHELKTPIAVIHATCDNLAADLDTNSPALERVDVIRRSADRMQRLVSDLLLLTKSEKAQLTLQMVPMRFDMLLREVLGEFGDLCEDKGIELKADDIAVGRMHGDKDALHRMIANLLENASNYTNSGGTITVSLKAVGSGLVLSVSDTGIGIPPESLEKIFDRFYRVDESRTRAKGGSGLGLSIVRAIAESHHGNVTVHSEVGVGTTFTISLPAIGQTSIFRKTLQASDIAEELSKTRS